MVESPAGPVQARNIAREIRDTLVPDGAVALWWLGQSSIIVKAAGRILGFDLYLTGGNLTGRSHRAYDAPVRPDELDMMDVVLCSHEHLDHLDPATLRGIAQASPEAQFIVPQACVGLARGAGLDERRVHPSWAGRPMDVRGVTIVPIRAAHETFDLADQGHRWQGFIVTLGGVTLCHAGDTVMYDGLVEELRRHRVELLLVPINGRDYHRTRAGVIGNLGYREAAELAVEARVKLVIPLHYDLLPPNVERPGHFVDYLYERFPTQPCKIMARGERFFFLP
ncbi:MAG TPA: MBL fold metallo-hydrolase [bacterium]|nr:MBL fold metallo-hydrolase [bacterium]